MKKFLLFLMAATVLIACGSDDSSGSGGGDDGPTGDTYSRSAMLTHWTNNIIKPGYATMASRSANLKSASDAFVATPNEANLATLRNNWLSAYKQFQRVSMFEIGKAEELRLRNNLNAYPTDAASILNNIDNPEISLTLSSEIDAQGFPAIEYLLYGVGATNADVVEFYTTNAKADANKTYLTRLTDRLNDLITQVNDDWQGSYASTFSNNSGSSATSSVNKLANDFMFYYERSLRAGKVGIPAGVFSDNPLPNNAECPYEGSSAKEMLQISFDATRDFFNGVSASTTNGGAGFADYLNHLNVQRNGQNLSSIINAQWDVAQTQINGLNNDLKTQVETNNTHMLTTYDELQTNVVYLKVDMMQALNIAIDYVDADGD